MPLEIRLPAALRTYVTGFSVVWCGLLLFFGVRAVSHRPATAVPLLLRLAVGATLGWRLSRLAVVAHGEELVVRNNWATHRWARQQVLGFQQAAGSVPWGRTLQVRVRDDAGRGETVVGLDACRTTAPWTGGRRRLDDWERRLQDWAGS